MSLNKRLNRINSNMYYRDAVPSAIEDEKRYKAGETTIILRGGKHYAYPDTVSLRLGSHILRLSITEEAIMLLQDTDGLFADKEFPAKKLEKSFLDDIREEGASRWNEGHGNLRYPITNLLKQIFRHAL